jgi:hypothetical protein
MNGNNLQKPKQKTIYDNWTQKGTVLLDFQASDFDKRKESATYYQKRGNFRKSKAFIEFQEICLKNKIQLYVVIPPNFRNKINVCENSN